MSPQQEAALVAGLVSLAIACLGAWLTYVFAQRREGEARRQEAALRHLQRQIEEFYGPLLGLIQRSRYVYATACKRLPSGSDGRVDQDRFSEADWEVWNYFTETYFLEINREIANLLHTKAYLMGVDTAPESYQRYLQHQVEQETLHRLWKERGVSSLATQGATWPAQFETDVREGLSIAVKRHGDYLRQLGAL
jgi:hypothetical protein